MRYPPPPTTTTHTHTHTHTHTTTHTHVYEHLHSYLRTPYLHCSLILRTAVLWNHKLPSSLHHVWAVAGESVRGAAQTEPYSTYTPIANTASVAVAAGSEVFFAYCDAQLKWFKDRDIALSPFTVAPAEDDEGGDRHGDGSDVQPPTPPLPATDDVSSMPLEMLERNGHCLTQVRVCLAQSRSLYSPFLIPI